MIPRHAGPLRVGIVKRREQADERRCRTRCAAKRIDHRDETERAARLTQIAEPGAKPDDRLRIEAGVKDELIELVVFGFAAEHT